MARPNPKFTVYIDEAGDMGFKFRNSADGSKGSSEWFIVAAAVVREAEHSAFIDEINYHASTFGKARRLHFVDMRHTQRVAWLTELLNSPIRITSVITHKKSLERTDPDSRRLYFFTIRYLLERISWICKKQARLVFAHSGRLPYDRLKDYIRLLCDRRDLDRNVIDSDSMEVGAVSQFPCLQAADAAASSIAQALEYDRTFNTIEHRYIKILKPLIYKGANYRNHGMKLHPDPLKTYMESDSRVEWMKRHYW